jgi:hypothetical protein
MRVTALGWSVTDLPAASLETKVLAVEPEEHLRHAVVAVRQNVGKVLAAFDGFLGDAHKRGHGTSPGDLEVGGVAAAAMAFAVKVKAVAGT